VKEKQVGRTKFICALNEWSNNADYCGKRLFCPLSLSQSRGNEHSRNEGEKVPVLKKPTFRKPTGSHISTKWYIRRFESEFAAIFSSSANYSTNLNELIRPPLTVANGNSTSHRSLQLTN
jgi:hypothetical protein